MTSYHAAYQMDGWRGDGGHGAFRPPKSATVHSGGATLW